MLASIDNENFNVRVRENPDPRVVFFTGPQCSACKAMYPTMEKMVERMGSDIEFFEANVIEASEIAANLNIRSLPSLVLFVDGMVRDITTGTKSAEDIRLWIQENI